MSILPIFDAAPLYFLFLPAILVALGVLLLIIVVICIVRLVANKKGRK
jgi:hypothetical protein